MAEEKIEELSKEQLEEQLRTALESWPLYRKFAYRGAKDYTDLPLNIYVYCEKCDGVQRWTRELMRSVAPGRSTRITHRLGHSSVNYKCCNCPGAPSAISYYFYWWQAETDDAVGQFFKIGQWPALEERVTDGLKRVLDKEDLAFYKNALRMRNHNLGVAAVAYLRRVVENRINDVLDVLAEAAQLHLASLRSQEATLFLASIVPSCTESSSLIAPGENRGPIGRVMQHPPGPAAQSGLLKEVRNQCRNEHPPLREELVNAALSSDLDDWLRSRCYFLPQHSPASFLLLEPQSGHRSPPQS